MKYREEKCPICSGDDFCSKETQYCRDVLQKNAGSGLNGYLRKMLKIL